MKGIIALDIDGTITQEHDTLSPEVLDFFTKLSEEGWQFIFITGRPFPLAYRLLKILPFHYYLAVQNGAIILEMPSRQIVSKKYLSPSIIPVMEQICSGQASDFVIYGGYEFGDKSYFRPQKFSPPIRDFLARRCVALKETWIAVDSFENMNLPGFASLKCFGQGESLTIILNEIDKRLGLHIPMIKDPVDSTYFVAQATHPDVTKGRALLDFVKHLNYNGITIAAGDDNNDLTMLEAAAIKVVMETAPAHLLAKADIIAPSAEKNGIIQGLTQACRRIK